MVVSGEEWPRNACTIETPAPFCVMCEAALWRKVCGWQLMPAALEVSLTSFQSHCRET